MIAASVVDLPEPVGPVTSTRPRGFSASLQRGGNAELLERLQLGGDEAEGSADRLALKVDVHAEARETRDRMREVELALQLELLLLLARKDPVEQLLRVLEVKAS